jgi:malonate decarboxylase gamma subunit
MAYDIDSYAKLGLLWKLLDVDDADAPAAADLTRVGQSLVDALTDIERSPRDLSSRLGSPARAASSHVRNLLRKQWA